MTTILDVLEKGAKFLDSKGIKDARLNMELLVAHELGLKRMDLYLRFDQPLKEAQIIQLRETLKLRGQHTPIQHIIGKTSFHHLEFRCDHRALIPRPETEELVEITLALNFPKPARILDLGCGSGVLGLSIANKLGTECEQLILADLSTEALSLARENSENLNIPAECIQSDLFSKIEGTFDLIVANLPYIPETERDSLEPEVLHDPEMALFSGEDGLDLLRRFSRECLNFLKPKGVIALEVGHQQGQQVAELLQSDGLEEIELRTDLCGIKRFPLARKP
ncbi:peptide chain release factor N(5)-glutamine methyltransferase [Akkermansiaceae bacterium]|nr:peptide chain release factor N(5)-glutamine methyltransferase [Akkermansiaceae bacterium]